MRGTGFGLAAAALAILLAAGCAGTAEKEELSFAKASQLASEQGKLLLVDFYTDW
jgi:outer membrane murein-binding lipoprotein Lpp